RSDACRQRGPDLSEVELGFGPEFHFVRDTNLLAPRLVPSPIFRQIQPIGDRQAGGVIGDRKRHRDLTIVGLAEPPTCMSPQAATRRPVVGVDSRSAAMMAADPRRKPNGEASMRVLRIGMRFLTRVAFCLSRAAT